MSKETIVSIVTIVVLLGVIALCYRSDRKRAREELARLGRAATFRSAVAHHLGRYLIAPASVPSAVWLSIPVPGIDEASVTYTIEIDAHNIYGALVRGQVTYLVEMDTLGRSKTYNIETDDSGIWLPSPRPLYH